MKYAEQGPHAVCRLLLLAFPWRNKPFRIHAKFHVVKAERNCRKFQRLLLGFAQYKLFLLSNFTTNLFLQSIWLNCQRAKHYRSWHFTRGNIFEWCNWRIKALLGDKISSQLFHCLYMLYFGKFRYYMTGNWLTSNISKGILLNCYRQEKTFSQDDCNR